MKEVGRNDPCPCGSGKKFKKCCALKSPLQRRKFTALNPSQSAPGMEGITGMMSKTIRETKTETDENLEGKVGKQAPTKGCN